jgi:predicted RNA-binding Zn-ribbon protein involved in translation (DUF1610 family)
LRNLPLAPPTCVPDLLALYHKNMAYPIKTCVVCGEEFELKPGKPGFANRCPDCSEGEATDSQKSSDPLNSDRGANAARREAMRNLLYRKDS